MRYLGLIQSCSYVCVTFRRHQTFYGDLVVATPDIVVRELTNMDEFILMGTRTFWKAMSAANAVQLARYHNRIVQVYVVNERVVYVAGLSFRTGRAPSMWPNHLQILRKLSTAT
jgi:uncharacterized protein (DUF2237 family)